MKTAKKYHHMMPVLLVLSPSIFWTPSANASSSFGSGATLSYTINSISNLDHEGSLADLLLTSSFELAAAPDYALALSGDGNVTGDNPNIGPTSISPATTGNIFSHTFSLNGNVNSGTVNTSQLGLFGLKFENTGADTYSIGITLNYKLNSSVTGQFGDNSVALDYYNEDASFSGSDRIDTSIYTQQSTEWLGTSGVFNFTLGPGGTETLYGDVKIAGSLEASPVPLPGGFWLLFSGLSAVYSFGRRPRRSL